MAFNSAADAQKYLADSNSGKVTWDDNARSEANSFISNNDPYQKNLKLAQQAVQPAVSSLEQSIPEVTAQFENERTRLQNKSEPLKAQYDNLLSKITADKAAAVNTVTKNTTDALARRGIQGGSFFTNEVTGATQPVESTYQNQYNTTALQKEEGLQNLQDLITQLTTQQTSSVRDIRTKIAGLLSGAGNTALTQTNVDTQNAIAQAELALKSQPTASEIKPIKIGNTAYFYDPSTGKIVNTVAGSGGGVSDEDFVTGLDDIFRQFGGG